MVTQISRAHMLNPQGASDGFFLNLCWLLLRLYHPFITKARPGSLLLVDSSYCTATSEQAERGDGVIGPLADFSKDSRLSTTVQMSSSLSSTSCSSCVEGRMEDEGETGGREGGREGEGEGGGGGGEIGVCV